MQRGLFIKSKNMKYAHLPRGVALRGGGQLVEQVHVGHRVERAVEKGLLIININHVIPCITIITTARHPSRQYDHVTKQNIAEGRPMDALLQHL